jgi:hypothetical protein
MFLCCLWTPPGPRQAEGIVSYLKKRAGPASAHLKDADKAAALKVRMICMYVCVCVHS